MNEFINLDLPSSTLRATCNAGIKNPELYFQWTNNIGYTAKELEDIKTSLPDYKYSDGGDAFYVAIKYGPGIGKYWTSSLDEGCDSCFNRDDACIDNKGSNNKL